MATRSVKVRNRKPDPSKADPKGRGVGYVLCFLAGCAATAGAWALIGSTRSPDLSTAIVRSSLSSHYDLLAMSPDDLGKVDLAVSNLSCAKGLPGAENLDIPAIQLKLDEWATKIKAEIQRHLYRVTDPRYADHYAHSEARLRAEFIVQCLQEDCGVHYNMDRVRQVDFSNPADLFIHGMVNNTNGGTCSSMPVLYAAIGRRLGYPIKLVLAKQHVFCRWDDGKERFNIEAASNGGIDYPPDEHYRTWPIAISDTEMKSGEFLKSLTPQEELATFLLQRASCLRAHRRTNEERACLAEALQLMPNSRTLQMAFRSTFGSGIPSHRMQQYIEKQIEQQLPPDVRATMPPDPEPKIPMPGMEPQTQFPGAAPRAQTPGVNPNFGIPYPQQSGSPR